MEDKIIDFMKSKEYVPMKAKELAYVLGITKKEYNQFVLKLKKLEEEYKITKNKKNKYKLNNIETIIKDYPDDDYTIPEQLTGNYNLPKEN